jgi:hypothetical protein
MCVDCVLASRESLKLILVDEPLPEVVLSQTAPDWVLEIWDRILFIDVSYYLTTHSCLRFFPTRLLASLKPETRTSLFPSFIPQIWHLSILGPNPILQPREPLCFGHNVSFMSPYFHWEAIVMTSKQLFVYRCNPVYVWDGTSGSHDMRGPMSIASKSAALS